MLVYNDFDYKICWFFGLWLYMSDFLKKNSNYPAKGGVDKDGLGASHQRFVNRFGKNKTKAGAEDQFDSAPINSTDLTKPDYYSPPTASSLATQELAHTSYNTSTWYSLNGRIGRIRLLAFGVIWGLITTLLYIIGILLGSALGAGAVSVILAIIFIFTLPAAIYSYIILPRRRLHDIGKSGWWLLLLIVPLANILLLLYMYFTRGDEGVNAYGLPPAPYTQTEFWLALLLPILAIIGIVAGLLLPNLFEDTLLNQMPTTEDTVIVEGSDADTAAAAGTSGADVTDVTDVTEVIDPQTNPAAEATAMDNLPGSTDGSQTVNANAPEINMGDQSVIEHQEPISFEEFKQEAQTTIYREDVKPEPAP